MGTKYSSNSASGYNATPPADDGTVSEANKVKWSTAKTKLADPIKDLADAINTDLGTHFDRGPTTLTSNTTLGASHFNQFIQVSGSGVTLTLTDAATLAAGWYADIVNTDPTNSVSLARATASNTIDATSNDITILPLQSFRVFVNAATNGFRTFGNEFLSGSVLTKIPVVSNLALTATVGSSALTIALKGEDGNDPSPSNPVRVPFRNVTAGTGTHTWLTVTTATSLVISSGSTLGTVSAEQSQLAVVGFNDGGTFRLGAVNIESYLLNDDTIASSSAEGGAGAADTAGVIYTGSAVSSKAMKVLGLVESTQATAGTWATTPSRVQVGSQWLSEIYPRSLLCIKSITAATSIAFVHGTDFDFSVADSFIFQFSRTTFTANGVITAVVGTGAGPTYDTGANYGGGTLTHDNNALGGFAGAANGLQFMSTGAGFAVTSDSTSVLEGWFRMKRPRSTASTWKFFDWGDITYRSQGPGNPVSTSGYGAYSGNLGTALTGIRFDSASNWATTIKVYKERR